MIIGIDASRAFISDKTGTENYSFHLINALLRLPESKSHTFVLFTRPNPILPKELDGYTNVIVKIVHWPYLWTQVGLAWETYQKFTIYNLQFSIDVLWIPAHTLPVLRNPKIKTVVTIHGLEYQWLPEYKNLLQRWYLPLSTFYAANSADKLIAVSKFTRKELVKAMHIVSNQPKAGPPWAGKIKVIHEGVELRQITNLKFSNSQIEKTLDKYGLQSKKYILFVGSVQPRKNLVALVEAFSFIAKELLDIKLVIAGGIGWMAEEVLRAQSRFGVQEKVIFTGRVSETELGELYIGATVYVQPSITEGFGLPVLEAMANSVPVISSDGGALPEVVGKAGLIVQLNNQSSNTNNQNMDNFVSRLSAAMERVIGDKKLQKKLIAMGLERVKEFSWEKAAEMTLEVLVGEGYKNYRG